MKHRNSAILAVLLGLIVAAGLCACAKGAKTPSPAPAKPAHQDKILEYLDLGHAGAAQSLALERLAKDPNDYENYLTLAVVHLAMRHDEQALADMDAGLTVFEAGKKFKYPAKEQKERLAVILKDYALTALVASRRAADPDDAARYRQIFETNAALVKDLDAKIYQALMSMIAQPGGEEGASGNGPPKP